MKRKRLWIRKDQGKVSKKEIEMTEYRKREAFISKTEDFPQLPVLSILLILPQLPVLSILIILPQFPVLSILIILPQLPVLSILLILP